MGPAALEGPAVMFFTAKTRRTRRKAHDVARRYLALCSLCLRGSKYRLAISLCFALVCALASSTYAAEKPTVIVVVGAPGEPQFAKLFHEWAEKWQAAAKKADADFQLVGDHQVETSSDRDRLQMLLAEEQGDSAAPLWLVLIGHGTFDGQNAKFNLRGADLSAEELGKWLAPVKRPLAVIDCASASAPFLKKLAGANRVVITATKSGDEQNFAYFGRFIAAAIDDANADIDKDGQVSLLEAYLTACRDLDEFYKQDARLASEHALLDDNGDGLGTPATWFRGVRATQRAKDGATLDGTRAHQFHLITSDREKHLPPEVRERRDSLELAIEQLRDEKPKLKDDEYYDRLEKLMVELARLYEPQK